MNMPDLIKSIDKVDDHTVRFVLNQPEAPFIANLGMQFASILSAEYADKMRAAGTPDNIDQNPVGTGPFQLVNYQKDAVIRYKANPDYWGGKAAHRYPGVQHHAGRRGALRQAAGRRMPSDALSQSGRPRGHEGGSGTQGPWRRKASTSAISRSTPRKSRSTTSGCARRSTWRSTRTPSSTPSTSAPARRPRTRFRRPSGPTTTTSWTTSTIPRRPRSCSPRPAIPTASRPTSGRCRSSGPTTPTPGAWRR